MSPLYDICEVCGHLVPLEHTVDRCPVCAARLDVPLEDGADEPDRGGVVILAGLSGMSGALVGFVVALVLAC